MTIKGGSNIVKKVIKVVTIVRKVIVIILGYRHHTEFFADFCDPFGIFLTNPG